MTKILLLVTEYDEDTATHAAHAHGITLKNAGKKELVKAVKEVREKGEYFPTEYRERQFRISRRDKALEKLQADLTTREKEVLKYILEGKNAKQISKQLDIAESTVRFHWSNLYDKFDVHNKVGLIEKVRRLNLTRDDGGSGS